ncbi:Scramblase-domain-containing protein [Hesseltinella vesiculosa]|uniref:Phospholipid scramblase n=1 Tax=Hesseltinella vesiculosa TaxID=101127 RepID=A0A1X2GTU9_9FUNG|nr:Scramblase-domain-containing protein [Hesseltinella vesiculosa]
MPPPDPSATSPPPPHTDLIQQANPHFVEDPVHVPVVIPQNPGAIVTPSSLGAPVLAQSALIVGRELEMLNVFLGYEQANRYKIMDPQGNLIGYIAEEDGLAKSLGRQFLRTHRSMRATIMDGNGDVVFKIHRPFSYINSRIFIHDEHDELIGEVQQRWHLMRRKYDLFIGKDQFAVIDAPFLAWDFDLQDESGHAIANVSRNFVGFAREIFTDSGQYVLRMDAMQDNHGLTLDQRAVMLACAISIDFDYFSRHSTHSHGGILPMPIFGGYEGDRSPETPDPAGSVPPVVPPVDGTGGLFGGGQQPSAPAPPPANDPFPQDYDNDGWLSDDQAGLSSPDDEGWSDTLGSALRGFLGEDDD